MRAIHAGLECGLFLTSYPDLDMISIGPTLRGVHSPSERLELATVPMVFDHLLAILRRIGDGSVREQRSAPKETLGLSKNRP